MSLQLTGPLPRSFVVAALSKPKPDSRRSRGWMRRRGLRPLAVPEVAAGGEVCIDTLAIDSALDFVQCHHPGCCALRPIEGEAVCAVCGRH
jgi:hypothetical protein